MLNNWKWLNFNSTKKKALYGHIGLKSYVCPYMIQNIFSFDNLLEI